jgi:hypothetical protein
MTLWKRKNSQGSSLRAEFRNEPYITINFILAGVILLIFMYSGFFSPDKGIYPVVCIHEKLTGEQCASCGLSHSFSLILRGRISEAYNWNLNGLRVFIFFAAQLIMRVVFSVFYLKHPDSGKQLVIYDIAVSVMFFIVSFLPFIKSIFYFL